MGKIKKGSLTEVATGPALSCPVTNLHHKHHVVFVVLDCLFKESLDFLWKLSGVLVTKPADVFALKIYK